LLPVSVKSEAVRKRRTCNFIRGKRHIRVVCSKLLGLVYEFDDGTHCLYTKILVTKYHPGMWSIRLCCRNQVVMLRNKTVSCIATLDCSSYPFSLPPQQKVLSESILVLTSATPTAMSRSTLRLRSIGRISLVSETSDCRSQVTRPVR